MVGYRLKGKCKEPKGLIHSRGQPWNITDISGLFLCILCSKTTHPWSKFHHLQALEVAWVTGKKAWPSRNRAAASIERVAERFGEEQGVRIIKPLVEPQEKLSCVHRGMRHCAPSLDFWPSVQLVLGKSAWSGFSAGPWDLQPASPAPPSPSMIRTMHY